VASQHVFIQQAFPSAQIWGRDVPSPHIQKSPSFPHENMISFAKNGVCFKLD
jgi:hypothetical protein